MKKTLRKPTEKEALRLIHLLLLLAMKEDKFNSMLYRFAHISDRKKCVSHEGWRKEFWKSWNYFKKRKEL